MISVAMAVYNGERFLEEQLASLAAQACLPGELIVCDDGSTDRSVAIARRFAEHAPFSVRIETSDANRGSTATFEKAIRLCQGRLIATCDQDDAWCPTKLGRIEAVMHEAPHAGFAFSDAEIVGAELQPSGERLWGSLGFTDRRRRQFHTNGFRCLLRRNYITGATLAFRASLRDRLLPIPTEWVHDAWIALVLSAIAPGLAISEPLIRYRQHGGQQIGGARRTLRQEFQASERVTCETFRSLHQQFEQLRSRLSAWDDVKRNSLQDLGQKLAHLAARGQMRQPGVWRLPRVLGELRRGRYSRYSRGWASALQDLWLK